MDVILSVFYHLFNLRPALSEMFSTIPISTHPFSTDIYANVAKEMDSGMDLPELFKYEKRKG